MLQLRHLAFASCLSAAFMIAAPGAHAAAMALPRPCTPYMKVLDRVANPVPSQDVGPGDAQSAQPDMASPDGLPPADEMAPPDVNDENGQQVTQPSEIPPDGGDSSNPPALSDDKDNGQEVLPQDEDDGN
jgi:hypothetical protein